jgi:hypothetical protein
MNGAQAVTATFVACTENVTGSVPGSISLPAGQVLCLNGARVGGAVVVHQGASLFASGASIGGAVSSRGAADVSLCSTTVSGAVSIAGSSRPVRLGDGSPRCGGDQLTGGLSLSGNSAAVTVDATRVAGPGIINSNSPTVVIAGNRFAGSLTGTGNTGLTDNGQPNTVSGGRGGQFTSGF